VSDDSDDIDAALQARAAQGSKDSDTDDIDAALQARAKETSTKTSDSKESKKRVGGVTEGVLGPLEVAGSAVANIPHAAAHGVVDLYRRLTGGDTEAPDPDLVQAMHVSPGPAGTQLLNDAATLIPDRNDAVGAQPDDTNVPTFGDTTQNVIGHTLAVGGDVGAVTAPVAAAKGLTGLFGTKVPAAGSAQAAVDAASSSQSMGAAGAAVDASKLTTDTQAHLAELHASGRTANATALANHAEAETLPIPVRMTRGQALENESIKTQEHNSKQEHQEIGKRYDEQDEALRDNLDTFHREAAPTAVGNDITQNDSAVIDSLKRYDVPKRQAITDAYQSAKDANGGDLPMDGGSFVSKAEQNLKESNRTRFLPSEVRGILDDIKANDGKMSFDEFESNRTILAEQARKAERAGDGTAAFAVSQVRKALEDTPVSGVSAEAKALYDKARGLAKSRFQEMEADPAYDAAANDKAPVGELSDLAGKFNSKYVLNGNKAALQRLRGKLDQEGQEAMTSTGYSVLKDKAGLAKDKFIQNGYNTALDTMRRKGVAEELLGGADNVEDATKLGRVARKVQTFTRGAAPNTSGTLTGALAREGVNGVRLLVPTGVNKGIDILGGQLAKRSAAKGLRETLRPGAGLSD